jgi:large subunit ribosomal protein L28
LPFAFFDAIYLFSYYFNVTPVTIAFRHSLLEGSVQAQIGNNVSHSKHRTKRSFDVNLFSKKFFYVEENCWISLKISAAGLRLINKVGLDAALNQAVKKGYVDWKDIKVIGE